jgi:hypothetical protein
LLFANLSHNPLKSVLDVFSKSLDEQTSLTYLDLSYTLVETIGSAQNIAVIKPSRQNPNPPASNGKLSTLYLQCSEAFQCSTLGLDGSYSAMQSSGCAEFNVSTGLWVQLAKPICPANQ